MKFSNGKGDVRCRKCEKVLKGESRGRGICRFCEFGEFVNQPIDVSAERIRTKCYSVVEALESSPDPTEQRKAWKDGNMVKFLGAPIKLKPRKEVKNNDGRIRPIRPEEKRRIPDEEDRGLEEFQL